MHTRQIRELISLAVGIAAFRIYGKCGLTSVWIIFAVYAGTNVSLFTLFWAAVGICSLTVNGKNNAAKKKKMYGRVFNFVLKAVCSEAGVKIKVTGKELIPEGGFLLAANHRSKFDNMVLSAVLEDPGLVFISKPENFKIPMGGRFMKGCGYLPIDRENPMNAIKTISEASELIKNDNMSVGVFPEGTRGKGPGMGEFSDGCFLISRKAGCPVVAAAVDGTENIRKNFPLKRTVVTVDFVLTVPEERVASMRSGEISDEVYSAIESDLVQTA